MASSGERQTSSARSMSNLNRRLHGWVRQRSLKMERPGPLTIKPFSQRMSHYSVPENSRATEHQPYVGKRGANEAPQVAVWISSEFENQHFMVSFNKRNKKIHISPVWLYFDWAILEFAKELAYNTVKHQTPQTCRYQILQLTEKLQLALTVKRETQT